MIHRYTPEELEVIEEWKSHNNGRYDALTHGHEILAMIRKDGEDAAFAKQGTLPRLRDDECREIFEQMLSDLETQISINDNRDALLRTFRDDKEIRRRIVEFACRELQGEHDEPDIPVKNRKQYKALKREFDRQIKNLLAKGCPPHCGAGMDEKTFIAIFTPLKKHLHELAFKEFKEGHIPFIVVPGEKLLSLEKKIPLMGVNNEKGRNDLNLSELTTAEGVEIPDSLAYLLIDVENGTVMRGESPGNAVWQFKKEGRSPMTADEGVALILQYPEILKDHWVRLPGSRCCDDGVASLWLSGGRPWLGWDRENHSGMEWGSASVASRAG